MYNKLFTKILDSSIWLESKPTRIVWVTFIAVMDEQGFCQFATVENVARRANVTTAEAEKAIATLEGPDPHSSDPDNEGRRLERVPGGWVVRNAEKYRLLVKRHLVQEQTAERVRRHRAKAKKQKAVKPRTEALHGNAPVTPSETESEAGSETVGERARANAPPPIRPYGRTGSGPLAGSLPRDHLRHAFCGRVCLPEQLFGDFCRLIGGDPQTAPDRVRAFCRGVDDAWSNGGQHSQEAIGDDVFGFWRARWAEQHGTTRKSAADIKREAEERIWAQS